MLSTKRLSQLFLLLLCVNANAGSPKVLEEIRGTVVGVIDGDTLTLRVEGKPLSIRLEGIDAPETGQKFGAESREHLKKLVSGKDVVVRKTGVDQYKRVLGIVVDGKTDVCSQMVEDGWAWHFTKYSADEQLAKAEGRAKAAKRGIWQDDRPEAPWDYRAEKKAAPTVSAPKRPAPKPAAVPVVTAPTEPEPSNSGMIWVNGYTRKDGTMVKGYWRRK